MTEPYLDWCVTSAAHHLAEQLWNAKIEAYPSDSDRTWAVQDQQVKARYITIAAEVLKTLRPAPKSDPSPYFDLAVRITREHAAKVVGSIWPEMPWGESHGDSTH